jgi:hypothetical protein
VVSADRKYLTRALDSLLAATLRERAHPGDVVSWCGLREASKPGQAFIAVAPADDEGTHAGFDPSEWAPFEAWRGGVGFRLVFAERVIASHGGALFSGRGSRARAACALTLPLKEVPW